MGESVEKPLEYYHNNMTGTFILMDVMRKNGVKNIIFSSSATVYGDPAIIPITEECPKGQCTNPYGQTKSMLEQVMIDVQKADPEWNVVLLRYFNPIGAHQSGTIGENPNGIPSAGLEPMDGCFDAIHRKLSECRKPVITICPSIFTEAGNLEKFLAKGHVNLLDEELAVRCIVRVAGAVSGSSGHECFG